MKIRSRKTNRNTEYDLEDFLLKEFSKDKELFVPDDELSCNDCKETEDVSNNLDCPKSFLVKFKADNSKDPKAIKAYTSGFILPEDLKYEFQKSDSFFASVSENHYNLKISGEELRKIGKSLYEDKTKHVNYSKNDVKDYLRLSYKQKDWQNFLLQTDRTRWRLYIGKVLKETLVNDFGKIDNQNIGEAKKIDPKGFSSRVKEISRYGGFNESERKLLEEYL